MAVAGVSWTLLTDRAVMGTSEICNRQSRISGPILASEMVFLKILSRTTVSWVLRGL